MPQHTNRLATSTSPYLLQHAHNPVDWYPWGEEALARARQEDKPIFLSVGYASCHWCHVMEHESFENTETAALMNALFVNIKVDREERPDLDDIYMQAVQLFTGGHGGWPMSVFLTPALQPFFAGTYFPPGPRHGMPGFTTVLQLTADAYRDRRADVARTATQVVDALQSMARAAIDPEAPSLATLHHAFDALERLHDPEHGGFGGAPKFPHAMDVAFLLRYGRRSGNARATAMALHTLRAMAAGGIHDQVGGGFHRYATDARWLVPHFEKMLYDNALLARAYVEAFQVSGDPHFRSVAAGIFAYVGREMTGPEGQFWSAQDADSEGVEGKYFVWTADEIDAVCGAGSGPIVRDYFGVTTAGNFEHGTNVLSVPRSAAAVAAAANIPLAALETALQAGRSALLAARSERVAPGLDDKVIAAWNGLMISAFARAARALGDPALAAPAVAAAEFVVAASADGPFRSLRRGRTSGPGFLDDWACMIAACLDLYEATFAARWLDTARAWSERVADEFGAEDGGLRYAGKRHETLVASARNALDTATPAGHSVQASNLLRLALLDGDGRWREQAERVLVAHGPLLQQASTAMGEMLCALDLWLGPACEVAITGSGPESAALTAAVFAPFVPWKVVAGWPASGNPARVALLRDRGLVDGRAAVYICRAHACLAPLTQPGAVGRALDAATSGEPAP